jgi:hydrogenase maturation protease
MEEIKEIANAVLYEGYLLYPYRRSAIKNRQRWTIGVVYPREYSEANGSIEPCTIQTECLIADTEEASIDIYLRFLHLLLHRTAQSAIANVPSETDIDTKNAYEWSLASHLANEPWEEGIERELSVLNLSLKALVNQSQVLEIAFPGERLAEESTDDAAATIIREQQPLAGIVTITAETVGTDLYKIRIHIENRTSGTGTLTGNAVMPQAFVSTHTILQVHQGTFISLLDPPENLKANAQECHNLHTWPVLVGNEGEHDTMLSSPIILYDYPQIAPESPGSLFDGTEIDEILTLRIMTLTDEEKEEMRQGDERTREILERTESLSPEQLMKLHGVIRSLRPVD